MIHGARSVLRFVDKKEAEEVCLPPDHLLFTEPPLRARDRIQIQFAEGV